MGGSGGRNLADCHLSDSSGRSVDNAAQRLVITRIDHQPYISQQIFYLLALVKRHAAIDLVGNVAGSESLLQSAGLGIRPIQNGDVAELGAVCPDCRIDI